MDKDQLRQLAQKIINKEKWWDILSRFIDVLRINIFIVDSQGVIILPPEEGKYGGKLLSDLSLKKILIADPSNLISQFHPQGHFLESSNPFKLRLFAIPVKIGENQTVAYVIVGPVILNKRLETAEYEALAGKFGINAHALLDEINGIRIVTNLMMNSILDLLAEIIKNNVDREAVPPMTSKEAQEIYSAVRLDELLATLLDVALKMTDTESGSIMVADEDQGGDLVIKVSRGLDPAWIPRARVKVGEGISGLAVQENVPFVISQQRSDYRIRHLLKRPEIKHSLIMPLAARDRVFGVLNLHTKKSRSNIQKNLDNLRYLSQLLSSVFFS